MSTTVSLYNRLGGATGISDLVVEFYERVLDDATLSPMFENTSMEHLRTMQHEYFTIASGGPPSASAMSLKAAHAGRGITEAHYQRFFHHLLATLESAGIDRDDIDTMIERLALERDQIVDDPGQAD